MKSFHSLTPFSLVTAAAILFPTSLSAQIINIDFLSQRTTSESVATNYVGEGAAGGGTTFNGLAAIDDLPAGGSPSDDISVGGTAFLSAAGLPTTVGFSITDVGADHSGDLNNGILNGAYLFINSAENEGTLSANFTINGLTSPTADLYFYTSNNTSLLGDPTVTFTSGPLSATTFTATGIFTSANTIEFLNVPVVSGDISGIYAVTNDNNPLILGGLTIAEVPEPSTWAMMGLGAGFLLWHLRRSGSTI